MEWEKYDVVLPAVGTYCAYITNTGKYGVGRVSFVEDNNRKDRVWPVDVPTENCRTTIVRANVYNWTQDVGKNVAWYCTLPDANEPREYLEKQKAEMDLKVARKKREQQKAKIERMNMKIMELQKELESMKGGDE